MRRTPKQLERQERCFEMHIVEGKTCRQIGAELHIDADTAARDINAESLRRASEIAARREVEQAQHIARIDDLYRKSIALSSAAGTGALGAAGKALEMRAKILGLDAPTKIDVGLSTLLDALDVPADK